MRPQLARAGVLGMGIVVVALLAPPHVRAVNTLSNGSVSPPGGSTLTTFVFRVDYVSSNGQEATSVRALVAGDVVALSLVSGQADDGTFSGSSRLPGGSWPVTFEAFSQGQDPTLAGPTVVVSGPNPQPTPTAPPTPTPRPTPRSTPRPRPTPEPTAAPTATPNQPRSTPRPTPRPTARPTSPADSFAPATAPATATATTRAATRSPAADPSATAQATPLSGVVTPTPADSAAAAIVPSASTAADPGVRDAPRGVGAGRGPLLVLGGGLAAAGFTVLAVQLGRRRRSGVV